ncbi:MAG: branched-chain amino acid ABC transporter permease [Dehalococcoidia bacterium]
MDIVLQFVLSGLALGAIYAIVAQGIYITFAATRTFNFAQGELTIAGAFLALSTIAAVAAPITIGFPLGLLVGAVGGALIGILIERIAVAPVSGGPERHEWLVSTAGVAFIMLNAMTLIWTRETLRFPKPFGEQVIQIGPAGLLPQELFVIVAAVVIVGLLLLVLERTQLGRAFRAVAFNREAAELMGIDARFMAIGAYALSGALAGLAGGLVGPITNVNANMGLNLLVKAFIAAIVGGIGNPWGIVVAAVVLGIAEAGLSFGIGAWREAALLALIIVFLGIRPNGLFGRAAIEKV